jgi:cytochrome c554/c'-like protein
MPGYYTAMSSRNKGVTAISANTGPVGLACVVLAVVAMAIWLRPPVGTVQEAVKGNYLDTDPLGRAAYGPQASDTELILLASDTDWRVRSAAFETLGRREAIERLPLRDTPISKREAVTLSWLDRNRPELSGDICSVFARPEHARFGEVLVGRCLTCHAGRQPEPAFSDTNCVTCHKEIHSNWSGTAHANSLSHLVLPTVDATTRQPETYDFVGRKGLSCVACHEPQGVATHIQEDACLTTFTTTNCTACHAQTGTQWENWTKAPHYRPATWPPGSVQRVEDEEPRSCTACHMPDGQHLWGARRDIALLRSGIVMKVQKEGGDKASLTLQNMAGHAYPSGGVRRALQLYIQIDDDEEKLLAILADDLEGTAEADNQQPALQPGETRAYPLASSAQEIQARLVYVRNRFDPDSYIIEIETLTHQRAAHRATRDD